MFIPEGYLQINWIFGGASAPTGAQVTLGALNPAPAAPPDTQAEFFWDVWRDEILPLQVDTLDLIGCLVKQGPNDDGPSGTFAGVESGGIGNTGTSPAVALLVQKRTAVGGRKGRGRMYVPGLDEVAVNAQGSIPEVNRATWEVAFQALHDRLTAVNQDPVLLHAAPGVFQPPHPITSFSVSATVATQRHRQRR